MKVSRVTIADAPAVLNTNDKAMWVLGWNDCVEQREKFMLDSVEQFAQKLNAEQEQQDQLTNREIQETSWRK